MTAIAPHVAAPQVRARAERRRTGWARRAPLLPALVFTIIVTQLPILLTLWHSLESWSLVRLGSRHFVGLTNYADSTAEDVAALDRRTFGVAVDATGAPAAIEACFRSLDRGARLLIFGVTSGDTMVSLSPFRIYNDEITVVGSMAVLDSFGAATDLMAAGAVDTTPLLGPPFRLAEFPDAMASVRAGEGIKIQVVPGS